MKGLPKGWAFARIRDVCFDRVEQGAPGRDPVPYIDIGSIDRTTKSIGEVERVTADTAPTRARQWVREGDVLVSMTRPNLNAVALVPGVLDGAVVSTGFDVLRPVGILSQWLFNRVRSHEFIEDVCKGLQGVVYPAIRPHDVRQHQFPVPPLPEQHRIVAAIESYFSRLDEAVALLERVQRNLKRYRASVLKAAVEGRLVPTEAALARAEGRSYEPASVLLGRILEERRRRWKAEGGKGTYKEPVAPDTTNLPELPEGWCWATVESLYWDAGYGTSQKCSCDADGPPVLRIPNVQDQSLNLNDMKFATSADGLPLDGAVQPGDFLFIRTNGSRGLIGRGAVVVEPLDRDHFFASYLIRLRLVPMGVLPRWVALAWHTSFVRDQVLRDAASSAGQYNVSLGAARAYHVPVPPLAEQDRILAEVEMRLSVADANRTIIASNEARCARLRQSILKWAFEGRLADQDPTDEPASVLLERIRAERNDASRNPIEQRGRRRRLGRPAAVDIYSSGDGLSGSRRLRSPHGSRRGVR